MENLQEIQAILDTKKYQVLPNQFLEILKNSIEKIEINDTQIYIKLNKDLILHSKNSISISDGFNIQIAKQIHLNPLVEFVKSKINKLKFRKSN